MNSKYSSVRIPIRPTSRIAPMRAMPTVIVANTIGPISILISLMKPSPSGFIAAPVAGRRHQGSLRARSRSRPGRRGFCRAGPSWSGHRIKLAVRGSRFAIRSRSRFAGRGFAGSRVRRDKR